jgi:hypothetical protein
VEDWVDWELKVPKEGSYEIEVHCGCAGGGSLVALQVGDSSYEWTVRDTGHFQNIIIENVGKTWLPAGTNRLAVRPKSKAGVAIMDIRQIVLRPSQDDVVAISDRAKEIHERSYVWDGHNDLPWALRERNDLNVKKRIYTTSHLCIRTSLDCELEMLELSFGRCSFLRIRSKPKTRFK